MSPSEDGDFEPEAVAKIARDGEGRRWAANPELSHTARTRVAGVKPTAERKPARGSPELLTQKVTRRRRLFDCLGILIDWGECVPGAVAIPPRAGHPGPALAPAALGGRLSGRLER